MAAMTDYLKNKMVDFLMRGQAFVPPATQYVALFTTSPGPSGSGTEVTGGSYARVGVASSLANWSGTQGAGTTTPSSGSSGTTSNNGEVLFPAPTADWGLVTHIGIFDASTAGNCLFYGALTQSKYVYNGDSAPSFPIGNISLQIDN